MRQPVFILRHIQPAFGGALFALFGHDAHRMGAVAQGNGLHFIGGGHFKV